jgi:hypothetical protein
MQDGYLLHDAAGVHALLKSIPAGTRRKGDSLAANGAVHDLEVEEPSQAFTAVVSDRFEYNVGIYHVDDSENDITWSADCSCDEEFDCPHVVAALRELLAQHSAAAVRMLSSTVRQKKSKSSTSVRESPKPIDLGHRLSQALSRPLHETEAKFIAKVQAAYQRSSKTGHITYWDFQELGLPLRGGYGWDAVKIWPTPPHNEHEFWLYVAHAAQDRGVPVPTFMGPVTDLKELNRRFAEWERRRKIEQWKQTLANLQVGAPLKPADVQGETDLRLVVTGDALTLQAQAPGHTEFERVTQSQFNELATAFREGRRVLTDQAEWLWPMLGPLLHSGVSLAWNRLDPEAARLLRQILRVPALESRLIGETGVPLERPAQPVQWQLAAAANAHDDYRFHLVQADGSPLPPILAALSGNPAIYLTTTAVYRGSGSAPPVLDPTRETRIPAPALESASGASLLRSAGLELPPRLAARVETLGYEVTIRCELVPSMYSGNADDCGVSAEAKAADGRCLLWQGYNWLEQTSKGRRKHGKDGSKITLYDSAVLAEAHTLLEKLQARPAFGGGFVVRITRKFPDTFSDWLKSVPPHIKVQLIGELASLAASDVAGRVRLDVTEAEIDWFDLQVVLDVADTTLTSDEVQLLLKAKGDFVRLPGKGWRRLHFELSEAENERLARLGLSAQELSAEPQRLHAVQLADEAAKTFLPDEQVERIQRRASEIKTRVAPALPAGVTAELRPYQLEGFHFLAYLASNRFGGILADDMGLGKTLQSLAWLVWLRETSGIEAQASDRPEKSPALVVCPKSVMDNWRAEAERFTPGLRVRVWSASELDGFTKQLSGADLHVLNYSQLRSLGEGLADVRWQAVILDEGQYIKNPNSQTAQVARSLRAEQRLVLSGTPIENQLLDLWSLVTFAMPGVLGSRAHFAKIYGGKNDPFARRRLASRVRPFLLRRTKAQVAKDLPDRTEEDLYCEMEGEQQVLYRAELKRAQQLLLGIKTQKELAQQQFHFLVSLLRLRQICCDPRLRDPESSAPSAKTEALFEHLEPLMEEGQKVLVFSQFVELLDLLRPGVEQRQWPVFYLAGDTENRGELVHNFQTSEGPAVFLISLKAGGFGLNLTAASYVVLFDPWWNPAVENQAIDRTHRIGQTNKVIAYRLLIKGSIEEKIRALQKQKKALAEDVLGEERFSQSLTLDDLNFLFSE